MKTKEEIADYMRDYYLKNRDRFRAYYLKNHLRIRAYNRTDKVKAKKKTEIYRYYNNAYQQGFRHTDKEKPRRLARNAVYYLFKKGLIKKDICSKCSTTEHLEFHHADYSKPYEVVILCKQCHIEHHIQLNVPEKDKSGV